MDRLNRYIGVLMVGILLSVSTIQAQISVTGAKNMSVRDLLDSMFLGSGVTLDTTYPIMFNGKTVITSNQIGMFVNSDTSSATKNIPILDGIVIATCAVTNKVGDGGSASPASDDAAALSQMLKFDYDKYCSENSWISKSKLNDVGCLDFWVIPSTFQMSFKYSFGSAEYPGYVCSAFNDFFGLYVDGPYEADYEPFLTSSFPQYTNVNVATIPGTGTEGVPGSGDKVMINTINGTTTNSNCSKYNVNTKYFIDNSKGTKNSYTSLGGYTIRMETEVMDVVPCKSYHIQIAIANASDHALQSAVFLEKGSFSGEKIVIDHAPSVTNDQTDNVYIKGCSMDTFIVRANYVMTEDATPYYFNIKPTKYSNITQGVDYTLVDMETGDEVSDNVSIPVGDSVIKLALNFLHNENKLPGTIDTLMITSTDYSDYDCLETDTIFYVMKEPELLTCSATGGNTYCEDKLPQLDTINVTVSNAISMAVITLERGLGETKQLVKTDTLRYEPGQTQRIVYDTFQIPFFSYDDTSACVITVSDSCGRTWDTIIYYSILGATTSASVSSNYICEGDTVTLSCPTTSHYAWTAYPPDRSLTLNGQDTLNSPKVSPIRNTTYYVTVTSDAGCVAKDTISVSVEPRVVPKMSLLPKEPKYSDPLVKYTDLTVNSYAREWYFGDGGQDNAVTGYHSYPVNADEDSHTYVVTLIAYNQAMCPDTVQDSITLFADFTFYVPNAFVSSSSRGEEIATFGPKGSLLQEWELYIYNRWGAKIYYGKNKPWDGTLENGEWAPQGTYIYDIFYKDDKGRQQRQSGTVNLLPNNGEK